MLVSSSVRPSQIDGLGLFADEAIRAGTLVWEFDPRFEMIVRECDLETAPAPVRAFFERFGYARADLPGCLVLDADDGRYINHADDPNLDSSVPGRGVARRDIAAGEEITCNYDELEPRAYAMQPPRGHFACAPQDHKWTETPALTLDPAALRETSRRTQWTAVDAGGAARHRDRRQGARSVMMTATGSS